MAQETRLSWVTVIMLLLGAVLSACTGLVSSAYQESSQLKITKVQQENQMKQLLFSAQLVTLKSYGVALGKSDTAIIQSLNDFQHSLLTANSSQEAAKKAMLEVI